MENLYLVSLSPNGQAAAERLAIQFVPQKLSLQRDSKLSSVEVIGRENPLRYWTSGDTSLNLSLDFHSEVENREDVMRKVRWLESLTYQDAQGLVPRVKLVFGAMFQEEVWYIRSVATKLSHFHPQYDWLPCQAYVALSLEIYGQAGRFNANDIRNRL